MSVGRIDERLRRFFPAGHSPDRPRLSAPSVERRLCDSSLAVPVTVKGPGQSIVQEAIGVHAGVVRFPVM
jgi:hypothetical protein